MYYDNKGKIYIFSTRLDQLCHYETAFVAFYHSDQPVDYPGNPSHYSNDAGDYSNDCPDNHEDFLEDPGK